MWNSTLGPKQFMRTLDRSPVNPKLPDVSLVLAEGPDLLADNDNLREITYIRDALRYLRMDAKTLDIESESPTRDCEEDLQRYIVLICGRIMGGQTRDLTGKDLAFMEQILGLKIGGTDFAAIAAELRSRPVAELDTVGAT
jgi:hypothetical protein